MLNNNLIKIFSVVLIITALLSIIFGGIIPFSKSERYVDFVKGSAAANTINSFESLARYALDYKSPVGQEETTKFIISGIRDIIRNPDVPAQIAEELVHFIEPYAFKNDVRHLAAMGDMYSVLWGRFKIESAFSKSEEYYKKALIIGPNLPPILYSLLTIYQMKGDKIKINEVANIILSYWPDDDFAKSVITPNN